MKLHLPKLLLTAVLAAFVPTIYGADSISLNFYASGQTVGSNTEGSSLFGVDVTDWNDITTSSVKAVQTQYLTVTSKDEKTATLVLTTPQPSYKSNNSNTSTLEDKLMSSYLDISSSNASSKWNVYLESDMWFADVTLYLAGDGGDYTPVVVNGVSYIGGVDNKKPDDYGTAQGWGDRDTNTDGSKSYSTATSYDCKDAISDADLNNENAVRVNNVFGGAGITIYNEAQASGSNRATLAGLQFVDTTDEVVYTSTLGANATLSDVTWSKHGVEETTKLGDIAAADRYLSVTADAAGSTLSIGEASTIAGLHLAANNLTVTGSTLTTGALHAKSGTILTMEAGIAGEKLALSGLGTIKLNGYNYSSGITVASGTTVELLAGIQSGKIENSGIVLIDAGSSDVALYTLIGKAYICNPDKIANTSSGNIVIEHTGHKTTDGVVNVATGGTVTLKGGSAAIGHQVNLENNTTLAFEDIQVTITGAQQSVKGNYTINSGATLNLNSGDIINYGNDTQVWTVNEGGVLNFGAATANGAAQRQTLGRNFKLILNGGTVNGKSDAHGSLDFYNNNESGNGSTAGTILVTKDSVLNAAVRARTGNVIFDVVGDNTTLTMGSSAAGVPNFAALKGGGVFTKSGSGTLVYNGAAFTNKLTISSGVFEYVVTDDMSHNGLVDGAGTFRKSGEGTLTLSPAFFNTNLNVAQGKVVYRVDAGLYTRNISGVAGTVLEKTGKGTLKTNGSNFAGHVLVSDGIFQLSAAMEQDNRTMTVANGATLDVNGRAAYYNLTLQEGATLTNSVTSGNNSGTDKKQFRWITLEGTATVSGNSDFGMIGSSYVTSYLDMQGNTLIKEGGNRFFLVNTTVSSAGTIQVDAGKVEAWQNGNNGTLDISKLSVVVNEGGTFQLSGSSESIQDLNLAGGVVAVGDGHTLTAAGTTTMNGGKVTGNLCLSGAIILEGDGAVDLSEAVLSGVALSDFNLVPTSEETPRTSGLQSLSYTLWGGEGSVTSTQSSIVIGDKTYKMDATNGTFVVDGDLFYVAANDTVTVGGAGFTEDTDRATVFVVDGSLDVAGKPANDITINLQESSTLTTSADGDIGSITLAGNGLYDMGTKTNVRVTGLGDSIKWTGTVRLSGELPGGASLSSYGNANSKIEMVGAYGWLDAAGMSTSSRLILTKEITEETEGQTVLNGFTVTAASNPTYSFLGGVQGEGDFTVNNGGDGSPTYTFGGDLSEWSGLFHVSKTNKSDGGTVTLNLRNGGTLFTDAEAGVKLSASGGGTLNVNIGSAAAETVMNGSITRTGSANLELTVHGGSQLVTFNGAVGVTNMHVYADTVMNQGLTASNMLSVHAGKLTLVGSSDLYKLDMSGGRNYTGTLELAAGASLNVSLDAAGWCTAWIKNAITLGEEASFNQGPLKIVGTGNASTISVINAAGNDEFSMGSTNHVVSNASVVMNSDSARSLGLKLTNSSLTNEGAGTLTVNNAASTITNLHAQGGDITVNAAESVQSATVDAGRTLTLAGGAADNRKVYTISSMTLGDSALVSIGANATLNRVSTIGGTLKLTGSGVYDMAGSNDFANTSVADGWSGTVLVSGVYHDRTNDSGLTLAAMGNSNSKIKLHGVSEHLIAGTYNAEIELANNGSNAALKVIDGGSGSEYKFAGGVTGNGNFIIDTENSGVKNMKFIFSGDVSNWKDGASLVATKSNLNEVTFSGAATEINAKLGTTAGNLTVNIDNAAAVSVNGVISSAAADFSGWTGAGTGTLNLNVKGGGEATFGNKVHVTKLAVGETSSAKIGGASNQITAGNVSISRQNATLSNVTIEGSSITRTGGTAGSIANADVSLAELAAGTSYTIADMTLSNVTVTAATSGTAVNLTNVTAEAVQLEKGSYTMTDVAKVGEYSVEGSTASFTTDLLSGITLNNADSSASLVVDLGDLGSLAGLVYDKTYKLTIILSGFTMDYEADPGLIFAEDSWLGQQLAGQGVSGSLETPAELASNTTVTVQYAGMPGEDGANVGTIITITGLTVIPEPTTTTLSLLALCGLVARRRRK